MTLELFKVMQKTNIFSLDRKLFPHKIFKTYGIKIDLEKKFCVH